MSGTRRVLCAACQRLIPVRNDGRLRAHLASHGHRGTCAGSGAFSARVQLAAAERGRDASIPVPAEAGWEGLSPAGRFNAAEEWAKVDSLYFEYKDMAETGAASPAALEAARAAVARAVAGAEALAPWYALGYAQAGDEVA